jgi:hypothetical protein
MNNNIIFSSKFSNNSFNLGYAKSITTQHISKKLAINHEERLQHFEFEFGYESLKRWLFSINNTKNILQLSGNYKPGRSKPTTTQQNRKKARIKKPTKIIISISFFLLLVNHC